MCYIQTQIQDWGCSGNANANGGLSESESLIERQQWQHESPNTHTGI
jgi:hypothetical protein